MCTWLVVSTHLKNIGQNGFIFPNFPGENKTYLKPPPRGTETRLTSWFASLLKFPCGKCSYEYGITKY